MTILALDSSSRAASCALVREGQLAGEMFANIGSTHSQTLMPMVEQLLSLTATTPAQIDVYAVTTGPGSFTGLRIGLSCIKGMALATGKPCAGIPTLTALAAGVAGYEGYICPVMDARRGQVYTALFECGESGLIRISEDEAMSVEALSDKLAGLSSPPMLVGDGGNMVSGLLGCPAKLAPERFLHQRAGAVASLAQDLAARGQLIDSRKLTPVYLRLPGAERERLGIE